MGAAPPARSTPQQAHDAAACSECAALKAAALDLAAERGVAGLSDEALAARAGMPPDAVTAHGGSVTECLLAAYDETVDEVSEQSAAAFGRADTWWSGLRSATDVMLTWLAAHPAAARVMFYEILRGRELYQRREQARLRAQDRLLAEQRSARSEEQFPQVQFELMQGAIFQLVAAEVAAGRIAELGALAPKVAEATATFVPERVA